MKKFFTLRKKEDNKGFTLVELMIVVAIIGILAAIAIPQFAQYRKRGYATSVTSDAKNAFTAAAAMIADNSSLNSMSSGELVNAGFNPTTGVVTVPNFTSVSAFTINSTGNASWALTGPSTVINQDGNITTKAKP